MTTFTYYTLEGHSIQRFRGLSTDTKPAETVVTHDGVTTTVITQGAEFIELDTGRRFFWDSEAWQEQHPNVALLEAVNHLGETMSAVLVELKRIKLGTSVLAHTDLDKERI